MSTYAHDVLTARFAALAPQPLPGDWDDVLDRAGAVRQRRRRLARSLWRGGRRRKLVVALAVAVLVPAVGAAAYGTARVLFLGQGFVGLPPVGATPSAPKSGELVLSFRGRSATLPLRGTMYPGGHRGGPMTSIFVYADGRLIWVREGGAPAGANEHTSGFLEQLLTPEGVELLRSEVISTGLFGHDLGLITGPAFGGGDGAFWGTIQARNRERLVNVSWIQRAHLRDVLHDVPEMAARDDATATSEQEHTLERLDGLLTDPAAWLPVSAWQNREIRAYVPSRYAVCWAHNPELGPDRPMPRTIPLSRILTLLPAAIEDLLRRRGFALHGSDPPSACSIVPTEEARTISRALDAAGLEKRSGGEGRGSYNEFGLTYRFQAPDQRPGHVYISFEPTLPHGEWICTACG
jgi:hypothetical protein